MESMVQAITKIFDDLGDTLASLGGWNITAMVVAIFASFAIIEYENNKKSKGEEKADGERAAGE